MTDISTLPDACGVYLFRGKGGKVIYVGKAINIRARVRSHVNNRTDPKEERLRQSHEKIDWIATKTELEALILEDTLIKRYKPRFNIRLKDDKSYPYLLITSEDYPAVRQVRGLNPDAGIHFGPHGDPRAVRRSLRWLRRIFPVRSCKRDMSKRSRPCLEHHLDRCMAPCSGEVELEDYGIAVQGLKDFLSGRREKLLEEMEKDMWEASSRNEYEKAALLRDILEGLKRIREGQKVVLLRGDDVDAVHIDDGSLAATVIKIREGRIIDSSSFTLEGTDSIQGADADFLSSYYSLSDHVPRRIIISPISMDNEVKEELTHFLGVKSGGKILIRGPRGEDERATLEMAARNTRLFIQKREREIQSDEVLNDLMTLLKMDCRPEIIEGFDISHLHGEGTVASMVRFKEGKPLKSGYRKFRIRGAGNDDFAAMYEVIRRRYARLINEGGPLPDLILIDGGKGQLNAAMKALDDLETEMIPLTISLAKKEEEIHTPGRELPIKLKRSEPVLMLLQRIRDESHRFAVSYQRKLREKELHLLRNVEGIGDIRARELLNSFDSIEEMIKGGAEMIVDRTGIPKRIAEDVIRFLE